MEDQFIHVSTPGDDKGFLSGLKKKFKKHLPSGVVSFKLPKFLSPESNVFRTVQLVLTLVVSVSLSLTLYSLYKEYGEPGKEPVSKATVTKKIVTTTRTRVVSYPEEVYVASPDKTEDKEPEPKGIIEKIANIVGLPRVEEEEEDGQPDPYSEPEESKAIASEVLVKFSQGDVKLSMVNQDGTTTQVKDEGKVSYSDLDQSSIPSALKDINDMYGVVSVKKIFPDSPEGPLASASSSLESLYKIEVKGDLSKPTLKEVASKLEEDPQVERAELNYLVYPTYVPNDPNYSQLWGLKRINVEKAWDISQGQGVVVAVVDSGVDYNHEDLKDNMWKNQGEIPENGLDDDGNGYVDDYHGYAFFAGMEGGEDSSDPMDTWVHGTHVAGTIAAVGDNNKGVIGVAPKAKIMPLAFLSSEGGSVEDAIKAIKYAADMGAKVINASWGAYGCDIEAESLRDAIIYARSKGVIFVNAAGNNNSEVICHMPSGWSEVLTVGATDLDDLPASFSNWGNKIEVSAPGRQIFSTVPPRLGCPWGLGYSPGSYCSLSGTSMAAPHVSGLAALLFSNDSSLSVDDLIKKLMSGSTELEGDRSVYGYHLYRSGYLGAGVIDTFNSLTGVDKAVLFVLDADFEEDRSDKSTNPNGIFEPGEKVKFGFKIKNSSLEGYGNVSAEISTDSAFADIPVSQVDFGAIPAGGMSDNYDNPFEIIIGGTVPKDEQIPISVSVKSDDKQKNAVQNIYVGIGVLPLPVVDNPIFSEKRQIKPGSIPCEGFDCNNLNRDLLLEGNRIMWAMNLPSSKEAYTNGYVYVYDYLSGEEWLVVKQDEEVSGITFISDTSIAYSTEQSTYTYDLASKQELTLSSIPSNITYLAGDGNVLAYTYNSDVWFYDISSGSLEHMKDSQGNPQGQPKLISLDGELLVYTNCITSGGFWTPKGCSGAYFNRTSRANNMASYDSHPDFIDWQSRRPSVSDGVFVWDTSPYSSAGNVGGYPSGNTASSRIYIVDEEKVINISDGSSKRIHPFISGHLVIYSSNLNGNWDTRLFNYRREPLEDPLELITHPASQITPVIDSSLTSMLWLDSRDYDSRVYAARLPDYPPQEVSQLDISCSDSSNAVSGGSRARYQTFIPRVTGQLVKLDIKNGGVERTADVSIKQDSKTLMVQPAVHFKINEWNQIEFDSPETLQAGTTYQWEIAEGGVTNLFLHKDTCTDNPKGSSDTFNQTYVFRTYMLKAGGDSPDTEDPSVSITDPNPNQVMSGVYMVKANATDNVEIKEVRFEIGKLSFIDDAAPFEQEIDFSLLGSGTTHILKAVALDTSGNIGTDSFQVYVRQKNKLFSVTIDSPTQGSTVSASSFAMQGTAECTFPEGGTFVSLITDFIESLTGDSKETANVCTNVIDKVLISVCDTTLLQCSVLEEEASYNPNAESWMFNVTSSALIPYLGQTVMLEAKATDLDGNISMPVLVSVVVESDTQSPKVGIYDPVEKKVIEGAYTVKAKAVDNVAIRDVTFSAGSIVKVDEKIPYEQEIDFSSFAEGSTVTITATARDTSDNLGFDSVSVIMYQPEETPVPWPSPTSVPEPMPSPTSAPGEGEVIDINCQYTEGAVSGSSTTRWQTFKPRITGKLVKMEIRNSWVERVTDVNVKHGNSVIATQSNIEFKSKEWVVVEFDNPPSIKAGDSYTWEIEGGGVTNIYLHEGTCSDNPQGTSDTYKKTYTFRTYMLPDDVTEPYPTPTDSPTTKAVVKEMRFATSPEHNCVLLKNGNAKCFGYNYAGSASEYAGGNAVGVAASSFYSCFLLENGNVKCQGENTYKKAVDYFGGDAVDVSLEWPESCVLRSNGNVLCRGAGWGSGAAYKGGDGIHVYGGAYHGCVLRKNLDVYCWGPSATYSNSYNGGDALSVALGRWHSCILKKGGNVSCYGDDKYGQVVNYNKGDAVAVSASEFNTCILKHNGNVQCWGDDKYGVNKVYDQGDAIGVSVGGGYVCVLKNDANTICWGTNGLGQATSYTGGDIWIDRDVKGAYSVKGVFGILFDLIRKYDPVYSIINRK